MKIKISNSKITVAGKTVIDNRGKDDVVLHSVKTCCKCSRKGHYTKLFKDYYCDTHYDQKLNKT